MDKVVREVWNVSLDACCRTPGGVGNDVKRVVVVGPCRESEGREHTKECFRLRLQVIMVARAADPRLPQCVRGGSVANLAGAPC